MRGIVPPWDPSQSFLWWGGCFRGSWSRESMFTSFGTLDSEYAPRLCMRRASSGPDIYET